MTIAVQVLEDECFEVLRPTLEKLIDNQDLNKQRAAAEALCGVFGGMLYAIQSEYGLTPRRFETLAAERSE